MNKRKISQLINLLTPKQKKDGVLLLCLTLVGVGLETIGVGAVIPAITLISQPKIYSSLPWLAPYLELLGSPSSEKLAIIVMSFLVLVYVTKVLFLALLSWCEAKYTTGLQEYFADKFFSIYMRLPYTFHLKSNSSELIRNISSESSSVVTYVIAPGIKVFAESMIVITLSVLLLCVEPIGAMISISVLGTASWIYQYFTKSKLKNWGKRRQVHESKCILHLQQGLGGIKDAKMLGQEEAFVSLYREHNHQRMKVIRNQSILQQFPRLWIELLAVCGLAILVIIMVVRANNTQGIVPVIAVFAAAAFRLMPSLNRILISTQSMRFGWPAIQTVATEFARESEVEDSHGFSDRIPFAELLKIQDVKFKYENQSTFALDGVSLEITRGEVVGLIGPSGSGKSTLIDLTLGLLRPMSGQVLVDNRDIQTNLRGWQAQIGYVPQTIFLTDDSLRRNIAFGIEDSLIDNEAVQKAIELAQLTELVNSMPERENTMVGERGVRLSGGQRQRIGIARALYHDPSVLVLDEATSALDSHTEAEVMKCVYELRNNKTVLIVAHRLSTVASCNRIYKMESGRIIQVGSPQDVLKTVNTNSHV
jgi:ABC-type multidrug transport system fused ATPase/permease subunit